jgi:hypothetical protein
MEGEGVVHALRHVHELLVPGGTMLDLHPVTEQQVETETEVIGVIREPEFVERDLPNAEAALRQVMAEGLYVLESEVEFDVLQHFDTARDLLEKEAEHLATQPELERNIMATAPPLLLREHVVFRRWRALP